MEEECEADMKKVQLSSVFQWGFDNNTQNFNRSLRGGGGKQKSLLWALVSFHRLSSMDTNQKEVINELE